MFCESSATQSRQRGAGRTPLLSGRVSPHLAARALTGTWLSAPNVSSLCEFGCVQMVRQRIGKTDSPWPVLQRSWLGRCQYDLPSDEHSLARLFCVDRWQLGHRSPTVQLVYRACVEYLEKRKQDRGVDVAKQPFGSLAPLPKLCLCSVTLVSDYRHSHHSNGG